MNSQTINDTLTRTLAEAISPAQLTPSQTAAAQLLSHFVATDRAQVACQLCGYAGTGKTTLVGALVKVMRTLGREVVLLAPTGRAAKVLSLHADAPAYTIHRYIYRQHTFAGEATTFSLGYNRLKGALFIVDEASMIATGTNADEPSPFGNGTLLDDLLTFIYSGHGCRLLLVGDMAQLPPIGEVQSPALCREVIEAYGLTVGRACLTDVVRQGNDSDVISCATDLRQRIAEAYEGIPPIHTDAQGEVRALPGDELIETLVSDYQRFGTDEVIVITRSNKRANAYNGGIRARIFDREDCLTRGDLVMVVRNNYYWMEQAARKLGKNERLPMNFIANGDVAEVVSLHNVHEQYGFQFADAVLRFADYADFELECRVLLTTLTAEATALTLQQRELLFQRVMEDYAHLPTKAERMKALRQDAYYNALQLKYAYAVTCHKAQGGQWKRVYIDQGYVPDEALGEPYLRWLYTAFTRTTERVYLVNWKAS